ncbi:MAG: hypothetical protein VX498_10475 [Myxococcota bacterium]|nr:hypothetical protein [Myxococcota bacterium]
MALSLGLLSACGPGPQRNYTGYSRYAGEAGARAYARSLDRWTTQLRLYDRWETSLLMKATFKAEPFRKAWTHEYSRRYILPQDDYGLLLEEELGDASRYHEFLIAVWANDTRFGHFEGDDAPWTLRLVGDDSRTVDPLVLRRIKKPSTEMLALFPFIGPHDRVFSVKFPVLGSDGTPILSDRTQVVKMQVAGVVNRGELVWQLRKP